MNMYILREYVDTSFSSLYRGAYTKFVYFNNWIYTTDASSEKLCVLVLFLGSSQKSSFIREIRPEKVDKRPTL